MLNNLVFQIRCKITTSNSQNMGVTEEKCKKSLFFFFLSVFAIIFPLIACSSCARERYLYYFSLSPFNKVLSTLAAVLKLCYWRHLEGGFNGWFEYTPQCCRRKRGIAGKPLAKLQQCLCSH